MRHPLPPETSATGLLSLIPIRSTALIHCPATRHGDVCFLISSSYGYWLSQPVKQEKKGLQAHLRWAAVDIKSHLLDVRMMLDLNIVCMLQSAVPCRSVEINKSFGT